MDNDDTLENKQSEQEKKSPKDDIPLWLQGLEDLEEIEETNPIEMSDSAKDAWVKEIPEELNEDSENPVNDEGKPLTQSGLPEWLREASEEEPTPLPQRISSEDDEIETPIHVSPDPEITEPEEDDQGFIELESLHPSSDQEISDTSPPEIPPDDEFIEIPTLDMEKSQDQEYFQEIESGDELPQWLQDMIAEPVESTDEDAEVGGGTTSEVEELSIIQLESIEEEVSQDVEDLFEESLPAEVDISAQEADQEVIEISSEITLEEETKPVEIHPILEHMPEEQVDEDVAEIVELAEQPHSLEFGKYQLDQGNIDQALEIFISLKERPEYQQYLGEIKDSLHEATAGKAKDHSEAWELLGDIEVLENNPDKAYDAYKQAIQLLLKTKEDTHGTD